MALLKFHELFRPLLSVLSDGRERTAREQRELVANMVGLSDDERQLLLPGGSQTVFENRLGWARTYLKKAGLLDSPRRGVATITPRGQSLLSESPGPIGVEDLLRYSEFQDFQNRSQAANEPTPASDALPFQTDPQARMDAAYSEMNQALIDELIASILARSPEFFEDLVLDVLVKMGYGEGRTDAQRVGRSHDGGIDGLIKADPLGLNQVYVQAKRWNEPTVGRKEIQAFMGALDERGARQGIFVTTSDFTREAKESVVRNTQKRIRLVNGRELAELMVRYGVGVTPRQTYTLFNLDSDYFTED